MSDEFWADNGEVLLHKNSREIYHVTKRLLDVDGDDDTPARWDRHYELQDSTHTANQHWPEEDLVDCFLKIGKTVTGKPVNSEDLRYWFD